MGISVASYTSFPSGAGRAYQNTFPPENDTTTGGNGPTANMERRVGDSPNGISTATAVGGTVQYQDYKIGNPGAIVANGNTTDGSVCIRLLNAAAGDSAKVSYNQGIAHKMEVEQLDAGVQPDPLFRVARFVVRAAFPTLAGALNLTTMDLGLCLLPGNVATMNAGGNRPGIQLGPSDAAKVTFRTRKSFAAAYDNQQDFTFAQLGLTKLDCWITYELRVVGADSSGPAKVKAFLNGAQIGTSLVMGTAAGIVPGMTSSGGGFLGLVPGLINSNTGAYSWYFKWMTLIFASDETQAA